MFESLTGEQTATKESNDICVAWDANALAYLAKGYSVIPLAAKQKGPKLPGWSTYCNILMKPEDAQAFYGRNHNIGLALGEASGVCAVDIDTDDEEWLKKIEKILPRSPVQKKGARGYTAFFKYNGLPSKSVKSEDGLAGIDFLSSGKQTVLPPSIHPNGNEYYWITKDSLLTYPKGMLPELSETVLDQLLALFRPRTKKVEPTPMKAYRDANIEIVEEALEYINPDHSYDTWIQVGLALQSQFPGKVGEDIFTQWSARGAKFDGVAECAKKYYSFRDPREITISTLFYLARQNGYVGRPDFSEEALKAKAKMGQSIIEKWTRPTSELRTREELMDIILQPVGFIAEVADWIKKVSQMKQDLFAVAAATSFVSLCYAHKLRGRTGVRTNNYIIAVGPSGSGKSLVCDNAQWLVSNAPMKLQSKLMGEMASSAGLIDELVARDGVAYAYLDEIGQFFRFTRQDNASQYTKAIGAVMTQLYSKADQSYTTQAYSSAAKRPTRTIDQPCFIIFGQSVPNRLYGSLTTADFKDGFFNRFTLIEINDKEVPVKNPDYLSTWDCFPRDIYNFWERFDAWTTNESMKVSSMDKAQGKVVTLKPVYTEGAEKMLDDCFEFYRVQIPQILDEKDLMREPLTRSYEQIEKYALTACEFVDDRPVVTERSVEWAKAFVDFHLVGLQAHIDNVADTSYMLDCITMKESLPVNKRLTKQQFAVLTRSININIRQKMMDDLVTQGVLVYEKEGNEVYVKRVI